jgi:hypothetical protein
MVVVENASLLSIAKLPATDITRELAGRLRPDGYTARC